MKIHLTTLHNGSRTCAMTGPVPGRKPALALLMRLLWAAALVLPVFGTHASAVLTSLHSFQAFTTGANPEAGLVQGNDGNFYGTTSNGGTNGGYGTVFKISTNGVLSSLYSFTGGNDGSNPTAGLVQGSDGNFYGTTSGSYGGPNYGTVFKISANGVLTRLYTFTGGNDGANPQVGLVQGSDRSFYGTTELGGTDDAGTVFNISTNGALTSLYSFTGSNFSGTNVVGYPSAGLVQGSDGNFYGTTYRAGPMTNYGVVFKISPNGALTSLYSFTGVKDGGNPNGIVQGSDGNFYGTTYYSGTNGYGTVFKISPNGALSCLYSFTGNDGAYPEGGLVQGSDGSLYGTTTEFGAGVFKISTNGAYTSLHSFTGNNAAVPVAGLVQGSDGNLYGTTLTGGTAGAGTVFQISTNGALTSLHSFTQDNDGASPQAGLVQGSDGNFYGTTTGSGLYGVTNSYGTVFKISANGALTTLYSFTDGSDGAGPRAGLVQGGDGNFYGTTGGTVFRMTPAGVLTTLVSGLGSPSALVKGSDGYFYGTTQSGGAYGYSDRGGGYGTVFKISTTGALTSLYSFTGTNDGSNPTAGLVQGSDGYFYGTTSGWYVPPDIYGTVFKISTNGVLTTLYSFTDYSPSPSGLVQGSDGNFYGATDGTVFKISTNGMLTTLYLFTGGNDQGHPLAGLVQGSDGNFYGTTEYGGMTSYSPNGYGTVFRINPNGALTSLYLFTDGADGAFPLAGLVQGSDGNFYGTTSSGGLGRAGTVFRLTIVPEFQAVTLTNSRLSLTWSTEAGGRYQVQYNSDLRTSNWINLSNAVTAAGATLSVTDSVTNAPRRFYRAVLLP